MLEDVDDGNDDVVYISMRNVYCYDDSRVSKDTSVGRSYLQCLD